MVQDKDIIGNHVWPLIYGTMPMMTLSEAESHFCCLKTFVIRSINIP